MLPGAGLFLSVCYLPVSYITPLSSRGCVGLLDLPLTTATARHTLLRLKLVHNGFWTTARLNPFFPIYPDGYFTDPNFNRNNMPAPFHYSSFDMVDAVADSGVPAILAGMVRLSSFSLNQIEKASGRNLREFYRDDTKKIAIFTEKKSRDFHYSDAEIRAYYKRIHAKCQQEACNSLLATSAGS